MKGANSFEGLYLTSGRILWRLAPVEHSAKRPIIGVPTLVQFTIRRSVGDAYMNNGESPNKRMSTGSAGTLSVIGILSQVEGERSARRLAEAETHK